MANEWGKIWVSPNKSKLVEERCLYDWEDLEHLYLKGMEALGGSEIEGAFLNLAVDYYEDGTTLDLFLLEPKTEEEMNLERKDIFERNRQAALERELKEFKRLKEKFEGGEGQVL